LGAVALTWGAGAALAQTAAVQAPATAPAAALPAAPVTPPPPAQFFFHEGDDVIMILGDSITEQKQYSTFLESFVLSRFPSWKVKVRNTGWSGDTANLRTHQGLENGLKRDILPLAPKAITIDFGMNDARARDHGLDAYIENETKLTEALKAAGVRVALITSSPEERYEPGQPAGSAYNLTLAKYSAGLQEVARKEDVLFVDQYTPFVSAIESGRKAGVLSTTEGGPRLIPDGVHPNPGGHLIMATAILKGLGAPSLVSSVEIDAAARRLGVVDNATAELQPADAATPGTLSFVRTDKALPWPVSAGAAPALQIPGFTPFDDLSRYLLKVNGLPAASYTLNIDAVRIGDFTREALAGGVNLSQTAGPISAQGQRLLSRIIEKNNLFFERWRKVQLYAEPAWANGPAFEALRNTELARLDGAIADAEKDIDALRLPVAHTWTLVPVAAPATVAPVATTVGH
jgi:lysophospholipase L1-like esterase